MARQNEKLPAEVEQVRGELQAWRGQRRHGQRIPQDLWSAAADAARRHGVNRVSRALGLDYYQLKRRCGLCEEQDGSVRDAEGEFIELEAARSTGAASCVVELEKGNGAKLRVSVGDAATIDWCRLKEAFLGA